MTCGALYTQHDKRFAHSLHACLEVHDDCRHAHADVTFIPEA